MYNESTFVPHSGFSTCVLREGYVRVDSRGNGLGIDVGIDTDMSTRIGIDTGIERGGGTGIRNDTGRGRGKGIDSTIGVRIIFTTVVKK